MTEQTKIEDVATPDPEAKEPEHKLLRAVFYTGDEVNQNQFKTFLKSCPFSHEGGQAIEWGRNDRGQFAKIKVQVAADTEQAAFDSWLQSSGIQPWNIRSLPTIDGEEGYFLAPEPAPEKVADPA